MNASLWNTVGTIALVALVAGLRLAVAQSPVRGFVRRVAGWPRGRRSRERAPS